VSDLTIRPTGKFIMIRTVVAGVIFLGIVIAWFSQWQDSERLHFLPFIAPLVFLWPVLQAMRRQFTKTVIAGDRLRYESGAFAKSTRTIQLSKLQDVRVDQTMTQRIFRVGNLSIETAGEASRLTIFDVDGPQALADEILNRAQHPPSGVVQA
jgi:uncharacterized membrane protein YdbT with pleckstrin-like domain